MPSSNLLGLLFIAWLLFRSDEPTAPASPKFVRWTRDEMKYFRDAVAPTGVRVTDALLVYTAESGLDPHARSSAAYGLCQALPSTLASLGWKGPASEFALLGVKYQSFWCGKLIAQQIAGIGYVPGNALELYVANFSPAAAKSRSEIIYRASSAEYAANVNLDRDRKGYIARADLQAVLDRARRHPAYLYALKVLQELDTGLQLPHGATEDWNA